MPSRFPSPFTLTRRRLLAAGVASVPLLSGCAATAEESGVRIDHVNLSNRHDAPRTVDLQVELDDGTIIYWDRHELRADDHYEAVDPSWTRWKDAQAYTVEAALDDGNAVQKRFDEPGCYRIEVTVPAGGSDLDVTAEPSESCGE